MPELVYTDDELGLRPGWDEGLDPNIRRELRKSRQMAVEASANAERAERAERELLLFKAGIPADPRGEFFAKSYDGPADAESVKAKWEELFGSKEDAGAGKTPVVDPTLAAEQRIAQSGQETAGQPGVIPLEDAIKAAKTNAEVLEIIKNIPESELMKLPEGARPRVHEDY